MMNNKTDYHKTSTGIFVPQGEKPVGFQCGFCPNIIFGHKEAGGRLFIKDGQPICPVCRVKRGKFGKRIRYDKRRFEADDKKRKELIQKNADEKMLKVAEASQNKTDAKLNKK